MLEEVASRSKVIEMAILINLPVSLTVSRSQIPDWGKDLERIQGIATGYAVGRAINFSLASGLDLCLETGDSSNPFCLVVYHLCLVAFQILALSILQRSRGFAVIFNEFPMNINSTTSLWTVIPFLVLALRYLHFIFRFRKRRTVSPDKAFAVSAR